MEFNLREFRPGDLEVLWKIDQKCFPSGIAYARQELTSYIERRGTFTLVAEGDTDHVILGFLVAEASKRGIGHIITIDVIPEARRSGVGSALLSTAEGRLFDEKCHVVYLETAVDNTSALAFYKRHEYFVLKTQPRYYSNGVDAFVLKKELRARNAS